MNKLRWTTEQINLMKKEYPKGDLNNLSKKINRSISSIMGMARRLMLYRKNKNDEYDIEIKRLYLEGKSSPEIAKILNIKYHSIVQRHLKKMGIKLRSIGEATKLTFKNGRKVWFDGLNLSNSQKIRDIAKKTSDTQKGRKREPFTEEHKRKIGLSQKGKIISEKQRKNQSEKMKGRVNEKSRLFFKFNNPMKKNENREKLSKRISGKNNYFWMGGITNTPYKNFNSLFKRKIRQRDNQVCMLCNIHREKLNRALDVHHVNYNKTLTIPENCISLCKSCHVKTHFNREHWTKFFQSLMSNKYGYFYSINNIPIINIDFNKNGK